MRRVSVLACAFSLALVTASSSSAQRVAHFTGETNVTVIGPLISATCGFVVTVTIAERDDVTLFYDEAGNIVREIDKTVSGQVTFTGQAGKSATYSTSGNVALTDYPQGASIGAPAIYEIEGNWSHTPGVFLSPGIYIWRASVVDFAEPDHIPITVNDELIESHGNPLSQGENLNAICSAISA